jgi:anti-anti-sigma factor
MRNRPPEGYSESRTGRASVAGTSTFRIDSTPTDRDWTIAAAGELDSGTSSALIDAFERAASEREGRELHLDLAALSFIDSAGLRAIIQLEQSARDRALPLVVTPPPAPLVELLELTGLGDRLRLAAHHAQGPRFRAFLERVELDLEATLSAPSRARTEVRLLAGELLDDLTLDAAVLLASELVANAVIHPAGAAGGRVGLRITCYEDGIRCEVSDEGPGFDPDKLAPRSSDSGGRGLKLVAALADRWGTNRSTEGTERFWVWFEVSAEGPPAQAAAAG